MFSDPKNPYEPNLNTARAKTAKTPLFRGSFCRFQGVPQICHRRKLDFRDQRPKKPIVEQIWWWPETIPAKPYFDWSIVEQYNNSIEKILNDKNTYLKLDEDPSDNLWNFLFKLLDRWSKNKFLDPSIARKDVTDSEYILSMAFGCWKLIKYELIIIITWIFLMIYLIV